MNILNNNVSQDYLKIQIIQTVLDSFTSTKYLLTCDDFKCLLDHLCKESCQLLRKSDRCALLLKIIQLDEQSNSKYLDQITNLISQLPSNDDAIKFDYGCRVMEIVLKKSDNDERMTGQEETLYKWMKGYVERNPAREMEFYSIKLAMESNESDEIVNEDITPDTGNNNNFLAVDEDLQKLKIFESFQM